VTRSVAIVGAPTSAGAYAPGQEDGPQAVRAAGLLEELRRWNGSVVDLGDIPRFRWRPDRESPRAMNVAAVAGAIRAVAEKVSSAVQQGHLPLVIGGDCTIELGTVLGMRQHKESFRLVYFDAHPDLNVPSAVPDGCLDWMGVAHLLAVDGALPELGRLGERTPALDPSDLLLFANSPPRSTRHELRVIEELRIETVPEDRVARDPGGMATEVIARLAQEQRSYLVHFDTDVIDFADLPLAENTDKNVGLAFETVMEALDGLLAGEGLSALTVTELNPHHGDADGSTVRRFVTRFAESLGKGLAGGP
jgi:arginase